MSLKKALAITVTAGTIATTGISVLAPKAPDVNTYNNQDGHSQQFHNQQLRETGDEQGYTEYSRQFIPGEEIPPERLPDLPFRLP